MKPKGQSSKGLCFKEQAVRVRALAEYKDSVTVWKDADPEIPILKQVNAEYAKRQ
jgi:hypothetical protein